MLRTHISLQEKSHYILFGPSLIDITVHMNKLRSRDEFLISLLNGIVYLWSSLSSSPHRNGLTGGSAFQSCNASQISTCKTYFQMSHIEELTTKRGSGPFLPRSVGCPAAPTTAGWRTQTIRRSPPVCVWASRTNLRSEKSMRKNAPDRDPVALRTFTETTRHGLRPQFQTFTASVWLKEN